MVTVTGELAPIVTLNTAVDAATSLPRLVALKVTEGPTSTVRQAEVDFCQVVPPPPPTFTCGKSAL